ncbi:hypothetical protein KIPB_012451, partial [Kipferlia bialata]|eukprot:g12451.t1
MLLVVLSLLAALACALCDVTPVGMRSYLTNTGLQILATEVEGSIKNTVLSVQDVPLIHFSSPPMFYVDLTDFSVDGFTFTQTTSIHPAFNIAASPCTPTWRRRTTSCTGQRWW